jgi:hypothetical protein
MSRTFYLSCGRIGETGSSERRVAATARSDASGVFRIADLPPGDYEVQAMMQKAWREKNNAGSIARKTTFIAGRV